METGKRQFSARKLYKLIRLLVIIIAILSGIGAHGSFRASETYSQLISKFDEEHPKMEGESDFLFRHRVFSGFVEAQREADNRFLLLSAIAIGLPIIFFGGTGIYRYLFPIQKERK